MGAGSYRTMESTNTRLTGKKEGEEIPPTKVECPCCNKEGVTRYEVNLCTCGEWFEVVTGEGDGGEVKPNTTVRQV